ncbi:MAG: hypothetical protein WBE01_03115, partial [Methyloceanibacter sp.]
KKRPQIQARQGIGLGRERKRQLLIPADTGKSAASRLNQQNLPIPDIKESGSEGSRRFGFEPINVR